MISAFISEKRKGKKVPSMEKMFLVTVITEDVDEALKDDYERRFL